MRAVADSGPLIHLSWIGRLDLLGFLFDEVLVPSVVRDEVLIASEETLGLDDLRRSFASESLRVISGFPTEIATRRAGTPLGHGEAVAIPLAEKLAVDWFLSDDYPARMEAGRRGLPVMGTVGILRRARNHGHIDEALTYVLQLKALGQWLEDALVEAVRLEERT
jgi:predicted nucleic acid-binding protein